MNLYEAFESNLEDTPKEFPLSEDASVTLLPIAGDKARRAFERMMEPYGPRLNAGGKLTDEENKALNVRFYSESIIKGWKGIKGRDGEEISFSPDNAKNLLSDEKLTSFFALLIRMASNDAAFSAKAAESDEGN